MPVITPFDIFCYKTYMPNKFYGIDVAVRNKINKRLPSNLIIEHGVYFSNILNPGELKFFANPVVYTMGKQREVFLKEWFCKCFFHRSLYKLC